MRKQEYLDWKARTLKLNQYTTLAVSDKVVDFLRRSGTVTAIRLPEDEQDHGAITVLLDMGDEEHYCYSNWTRILRKKT